MKTVIIYAHPWDGSFNKYVLDTTVKILEDANISTDVIDLYADDYDPRLRKEDLKIYSEGRYADPLSENYVERLKAADRIILIFPIWWYDMPAILKGFFDKVMLKDHAFLENDDLSLTGILDIKESAVFTTAYIDKDFMEDLGNPISNTLFRGTFKMIGVENPTWIHCEAVHKEEVRNRFLQEIKDYLKKQ